MGIREIRDEARGHLHEAMSVSALYLVESEEPDTYEIVDTVGANGRITVRLHTSKTTMGEVKGTSFDYAERADIIPSIVFLRSQFPDESVLDRGGLVSIAPGEAWLVDTVEPSDGITITAAVTKFRNTEGLPVPGDEEGE